jgi:hypothetical protein
MRSLSMKCGGDRWIRSVILDTLAGGGRPSGPSLTRALRSSVQPAARTRLERRTFLLRYCGTAMLLYCPAGTGGLLPAATAAAASNRSRHYGTILRHDRGRATGRRHSAPVRIPVPRQRFRRRCTTGRLTAGVADYRGCAQVPASVRQPSFGHRSAAPSVILVPGLPECGTPTRRRPPTYRRAQGL